MTNITQRELSINKEDYQTKILSLLAKAVLLCIDNSNEIFDIQDIHSRVQNNNFELNWIEQLGSAAKNYGCTLASDLFLKDLLSSSKALKYLMQDLTQEQNEVMQKYERDNCLAIEQEEICGLVIGAEDFMDKKACIKLQFPTSWYIALRKINNQRDQIDLLSHSIQEACKMVSNSKDTLGYKLVQSFFLQYEVEQKVVHSLNSFSVLSLVQKCTNETDGKKEQALQTLAWMEGLVKKLEMDSVHINSIKSSPSFYHYYENRKAISQIIKLSNHSILQRPEIEQIKALEQCVAQMQVSRALRKQKVL